MDKALNEIDRRAFRHDVVDGLTEMAMALMFLVLVIIWQTPAMMWMIILPILVIGPGLRKIRARTTYPRIGYVKPRAERSADLFRGMAFYTLGAVVLVALGVVVWKGELSPGLVRQASPFLASLLFGGALLYTAGRSGLLRYSLLFAVSLALGAGLTYAAVPGRYQGLQIYFVVMAILFFVVGLSTFVLFLKKHPLREGREDEHAG